MRSETAEAEPGLNDLQGGEAPPFLMSGSAYGDGICSGMNI